jgi:DNA-binding XRE family transcriptional regulator
MLAFKSVDMKATTPVIDSASVGVKVKRLRISFLMTRQELADLAGVPEEHVDLLERNLPVPLDSKRRVHKELWAIKAKK